MANKMLIDASLPEETRVVVLKGNRVEEFDFESQYRKQIRGNIYLAKVVRVEPSLQAAFVEFGGNRHGFLSFSEIHPDYYQIPAADREALLKESLEEESIESNEEPKSTEEPSVNSGVDETGSLESGIDSGLEDSVSVKEAVRIDEIADSAQQNSDSGVSTDDSASDAQSAQITGTEESLISGNADESVDADLNGSEGIESTGGDDALEEVPARKLKPRKTYKIQDVIKRRQILLLQVLKEERGSKGASLTTYISLAGRFSVLMPNTARGGGISRKIGSVNDRKRLKQIASDLDIPTGMGVIIRTAGASRTKAEIKRDYEYLSKLWEQIRDLTMKSSAPCLIYEEGSLIKRSIRDLYNKDISQIVVSGEEGYQAAKEFMGLLMPSHVKHVHKFKGKTPIFNKNGIEGQIESMFSSDVDLKSGGSIVINQTEALVSIDVNSGKATREHNIEDTALQTNLEACEEVARQLRLRDLAGLVVIDFIDMDDRKNNRKVEKRFKDCLSTDRARIQIGRISHFGLLEMSRQRLRTGLFESSTVSCPHCSGSGKMRSAESIAVQALRSIELELMKDSSKHLNLTTNTDVLLGIVNQSRHRLIELEQRFGVEIQISKDESLLNSEYLLTRGEKVESKGEALNSLSSIQPDAASELPAEDDSEEEGQKKRKRRRRRKRTQESESAESNASSEIGAAAEQDGTDGQQATGDSNQKPEGRKGKGFRSRRRGPGSSKPNRGNGADSDVSQPDSMENAPHIDHIVPVESSESSPQAGQFSAGPIHVPIRTPDSVEGNRVAESVAPSGESVPPTGESVSPTGESVSPTGESVSKSGESVSKSGKKDVPTEMDAETQPSVAETGSSEKKGGWWNFASKS